MGKGGRACKKNWDGKASIYNLWTLEDRTRRKKKEKTEKESWENFLRIIITMYIITLLEETRKERQSRTRASFLIEQYVTKVC